jgi:hypothetical protein
VIEFKHSFGKIMRRVDDRWYAGSHLIVAGATTPDGQPKYLNPYQQVHAYAEEIRNKLIQPKRPPALLPGNAVDWPGFKIQTAVCFTHPDVDVSQLESDLRKHPPIGKPDWEQFSVLTPREVPDWAAALRFEVTKGKAENYQAYQLTAQQIGRIAEGLLHGTEWSEILQLMPTGEPYAYLILEEDGVVTQVFGLDREELLIGRNPEICAVPLPQTFMRASREHARITRTLDGIFIDNLSSNGTYVNGQKIGPQYQLKDGDILALGGPAAKPGNTVCELMFSRQPTTAARPGPTAASTNAAIRLEQQ